MPKPSGGNLSAIDSFSPRPIRNHVPNKESKVKMFLFNERRRIMLKRWIYHGLSILQFQNTLASYVEGKRIRRCTSLKVYQHRISQLDYLVTRREVKTTVESIHFAQRTVQEGI
jgi:hypothetical protein